jgi:two-component system, LytTR family, response regulator
MIRSFILDDERLAVQRLERLLRDTGRVQIVGTSTDSQAALETLNQLALDVLFLDIQMPGLTGFELLEQLERPPTVVFTTAYDAYALDAFETSAIDYLLKPIEPERLERALDKVERYGQQTSQPDVRLLARELAAQLSPSRKLDRIASKVGERTTLLEVARVTHFVARDKLTFAVVGGRDHVVDLTLSQLEERLDSRRFVRIHRATIVNTGFVQELYPAVDGGVLVRLKDDPKTELSVARDRVRDLKARLGI